MKKGINLASEPFRRDRPMVVGSLGVGVLLTGLLCMLIYLAIAERGKSAESREMIGRVEKQLRVISAEQVKLEAVLRRPDNSEVLQKTLFLNQLLARKGVSWTRIFADLEKVTPHNVRLISIRPQIGNQNALMLDMLVGAQTNEPIVNFLMELEGSSLFGAPTVHSSQPPTQLEPLYRYRISVKYAQKL
jgi:type IV pilus assembly protein PilN